MGTRSQALTERRRLGYCDTSLLVRAYLEDEAGHEPARRRLLSDDIWPVSSVIADVEITAAVHAATRAGRLTEPDAVLEEIGADTDGPITFLALNAGRVVPLARELCERRRLRALDAIHLAVALTDGVDLAGEDGVVFLTRDEDQAAAARAEGLVVE